MGSDLGDIDMKIANLTLLLCAAGLLAACSSAPKMTAAAAPAQASPAKPMSPSTTAVAVTPLPAYLDPKNPISTERSVYFDFDDAAVKKDYFPLIERQGKYLASNPRLKVTIEGYADERGSAEYNLALGQKRAEAVLRAMKVYGAGGSQMEATSWGSEKPKASGNDEAAWAQNRRADIVYPAH
jgi:peptidoglycan-associated lipoprotein